MTPLVQLHEPGWDVDRIPVNGDMCRAVNDDVHVSLTARISRIAALRSCRRSKRQVKDEQVNMMTFFIVISLPLGV